ncbi:unnamed protein product, partial [Mesorhabditis spiculigera]
MGSSSSTDKEKTGAEWTGCLHFHQGNGTWKKLESEEIIDYFRDKLEADEEKIIFAEIRKYDLGLVTAWFGHWHEYTLVETTNWFWTFEKNSKGIYVQRAKRNSDVRCWFAGVKRKKDRSEGRSSAVEFGENALDAAHWIINRGELDKTYHWTESNCHFFASLLYEAITGTAYPGGKQRRLHNTL